MIKVSIARQVRFLDKHAEFDMYGTAISDFTHDCKISVHPTEDAAIKPFPSSHYHQKLNL
jgi:hypothetical protein